VSTHESFSPFQRLLITIAVMSATLIQVLDTTIVNVALPHMEGTLAATPDQITWVLTSYLVASAIFMPLTGYFTDRWGRKNYLLICIGGFVVASVLCGAAENLTEMVIFRLVQGVFGAGLVPLSQAIMTDIFPPEERGKAMALWGVGVMIGPILGPTLGGYLTDVATWRWNFYINVPIGIASMLLTWQFLPKAPRKERQMDWLGLLFISLAIGSLQYFLDRGNQADWLHATDICVAVFIFTVSVPAFLWHTLGEQKRQALFDPAIFLDRNFMICSCLLGAFGLGLYGSMILLPLMTEGLLNYPVVTTGLVMAPRGIGTMISMMICGRLLTRQVDARILIFCGILLACFGTYIGTWYTMEISRIWIIVPVVIQGFGLGMVFVPLSAVAFATLPSALRPEAAGLFSLLRTIGSSAGISIVSTLLARDAQRFWNQEGGFVHPFNQAMWHFLHATGLSYGSPKGMSLLAAMVGRQAQMLAYVNAYAFITVSFFVMLPLVLLLKKSVQQSPVDVVSSE